ncbi:uncharacterized protein EDB91DRAFT_1082259 [Suillus paluster]|uniref:uncharacterized protein n=1 Tax=Suillus paluster TaxID=48578 RepID=UPI001B85ED23|nr:uncharacterized protein EDB91DRAFT_1082259 [Suillus paluster]KAG1739885.1 hypothetical protein EDB91DRAFT_1082259 [Suillus paluster]
MRRVRVQAFIDWLCMTALLVSPPLPSATSSKAKFTMSMSVDDLVASLNANHIGQEAIDLAALQAQLAQTLFAHQISPSCASSSSSYSYATAQNANASRRDPAHVQHCTTPTTRTPSASISWPAGYMPVELAQRKRGNSIVCSHTRRSSIDEGWCDVDELDEERMVEDMIVPSSPQSPKTFIWGYTGLKGAQTPAPTPIAIVGAPVESQTIFTTTDPFYLQASQANAASQPPSSFFGNTGRPSNHSPFLRSNWESAPTQSAATTWDR